MSATQNPSELAVVTRHAGSVLAGQLAVMAFGVTDTVVAGRHSDAALAALSVGSAVYISVYVSLIGIVQALLPIYAELHGARRHTELGRTLHQTLYLCAVIFVVGMGIMAGPGPLLQWTGVPSAMQPDVRAYLGVLAVAFAPSILFRVYSSLNQALGRPLLVTWVQLGSLAVKIPLTIWFVDGGAGLAPMGAVGCAWATLVVNYLMLALAMVLLGTRDEYRSLGLWRRPDRPQWTRIAEFARLGVPAGLSTMIEVTSFTLMALLVARLGTVASASHQVAASATAMLYMFPLSLGIATSARVSYWIGAGHPNRAMRALRTGLGLTLLCATALAAALFVGRTYWASLYSTNPQVIALAAALLAWVALYHLADAIQCVCMFVLRSFRVTIMPMLVYGVFLWLAGLGGGYVLTYGGWPAVTPWHSPAGFWASGACALWLVAGLFLLMLRQTIRR